jgi:hypothetical protein
MRRFALTCLFLLMLPTTRAQVLPTEFVRDRIFVLAKPADGPPIRFFTDSGGGWNAISSSAQQRLKLPRKGDVDMEGERAPIVDPAILWQHSQIPPPGDEPWLHGMLVVGPAEAFTEGDGTLGSRWFAGRIWDLDYPARRMSVIRALPKGVTFEALALRFATDEQGQRALNFPSISVSIDGESIDVLLDTGA